MEEFDSFANDYRSIHTANVQGVSGQDSDYFSEYKIKELKDRSAVSGNAVWLDLGCGDGNTASFIMKYFPESEYHGIDVSAESIEVARERFAGADVDIQSYDGAHIPYADATFDVIFTACVLHHVMPEDRPALIRECARVLKPGGHLIIFEHNPHNPVTMNLVNTCPFDENAVLLTFGICKKLLDENGFTVSKKRYTIFMPRKGFFNKLVGLEKALTWLPMGGQYYVIASAK